MTREELRVEEGGKGEPERRREKKERQTKRVMVRFLFSNHYYHLSCSERDLTTYACNNIYINGLPASYYHSIKSDSISRSS